MKHSSLMAALSIMTAAAATPTKQARPRSLRHAFTPQRAATVRSRGKRYPQMVTASPEEIAKWNRNVSTRQVRRANARKAT